MKTKIWLLLAGLALSGLVLNGCYTQIARPDQEEDTQLAREEKISEEESEEQYQRERDDRRATNVYAYDDWRWRRYGYSPWYWDRYQRSRFYVSVNFGYGSSWCGTPWDYCDPWYNDYSYSGWGWPYYSGWGSHGSYYPTYVSRDRGEQKKRTITRRGSTPQDDDNSRGTYAGGNGHGSLSRPSSPGTFARGDDGSYRRVRRGESTLPDRRGNEPASTTTSNDNGDNGGRRVVRRSSGDNDNGGQRTPTPASSGGNSSGDSGSSRRGSNGSSGSGGGSVSRPSGGSSGQSSPPPSSSGSSGSSGSSDRRKRN